MLERRMKARREKLGKNKQMFPFKLKITTTKIYIVQRSTNQQVASLQISERFMHLRL